MNTFSRSNRSVPSLPLARSVWVITGVRVSQPTALSPSVLCFCHGSKSGEEIPVSGWPCWCASLSYSIHTFISLSSSSSSLRGLHLVLFLCPWSFIVVFACSKVARMVYCHLHLSFFIFYSVPFLFSFPFSRPSLHPEFLLSWLPVLLFPHSSSSRFVFLFLFQCSAMAGGLQQCQAGDVYLSQWALDQVTSGLGYLFSASLHPILSLFFLPCTCESRV